jgi:hypothetical protein
MLMCTHGVMHALLAWGASDTTPMCTHGVMHALLAWVCNAMVRVRALGDACTAGVGVPEALGPGARMA